MMGAHVRIAEQSDRNEIAAFVDQAPAVHRHLDWRSVLDWLGNRNFLVLFEGSQISGLLVCTAEPGETHWVRVFASRDFSNLTQRWERLFSAFLDQSTSANERLVIAAVAYFDWMQDLLERCDWRIHQRVVQLKWKHLNLEKIEKKWPADLIIRPMSRADVSTVAGIDRECFSFIWTQSPDVVSRAFNQSAYSSVAVLKGEVVGFQISTSHKAIAHLARLAVLPKFQGQYIGQALVQNMLKRFSRPWIREISVNTQHDNDISLNLYKKMGFTPTGESYPIFVFR